MLLGLMKLLGLSGAGSVVNNVGGILNHASFAVVGTWLLANADHEISFKTSYAFLALVVGGAWLILELFRRSTPNKYNNE